MSGEEDRRRALLGALIGPHVRLYHESTTFHVEMDLFAGGLVTMVDALAEKARREDAEMQRRKEELMRGTGFSPLTGL